MNDHAAVGHQVEGTTVVNLADDVNGGVVCIGRNVYRGNGLVWVVDSRFCRAYLSLLPPLKGKRVTIRVC